MSETNGSTALVSVQIQEAVERALTDVQQFIDSPGAKDKMQYVLVRQVANNVELQRCTPESFAVAVYEMFKLGLDPRGQNEAWLIPYKGQAKMQMGYAGRRKLALNDPRVADVYAKAFHQNDSYELDPRTGQPLHIYSPFKPRGPIIGYYAAVCYTNGLWHTVEMDLPAMRAWKDTYSRAAQKAVWAEDRGSDGLKPCSFDGMAEKTMLGRICHTKHMSLSPEAQEALALDDQLYGREKNVTPDPSSYVPTDAEHQQNIDEVWGPGPARPVPDMRAPSTPVPPAAEPLQNAQEKAAAKKTAALHKTARDLVGQVAEKLQVGHAPIWAYMQGAGYELDALTPAALKGFGETLRNYQAVTAAAAGANVETGRTGNVEVDGWLDAVADEEARDVSNISAWIEADTPGLLAQAAGLAPAEISDYLDRLRGIVDKEGLAF